MATPLTLKVFESEPDQILALKVAFNAVPSVAIEEVAKMLYSQPPPPGLDVLYLPLAAAERWGSKPLIHESQILPTSSDDQRKGFPPFIVTGACLGPSDTRGPIPEMKLLLGVVFNAIRVFNDKHDSKLKNIGFWSFDLLKGLTPAQLRDVIKEAVPELEAT